MDLADISYLILGGLAGGFINGFAGTGTALFSLGFFLVALDPIAAVAVSAMMSFLTGLQGVFLVRHEIISNQARLARFLLPGLCGVPIGSSLLSILDANVLRLVVAGFLILYGAYFGLRKALPRFERSTGKTDSVIGFFGGLLGGLAAISGALPAIWLSMRPWPKREIRAVLQPFNVLILATTVGFSAWHGAFTLHTLTALAIAVPSSILAAQFGILLFQKTSDDQFRRTLILLCLALGLGILFRYFIG